MLGRIVGPSVRYCSMRSLPYSVMVLTKKHGNKNWGSSDMYPSLSTDDGKAFMPPSIPLGISINLLSNIPPPRQRLKVFLDMDECLIHSKFYASLPDPDSPEVTLESFDFELGDGTKVMVYKRPGLEEFLAKVFSEFDTYVFTAGQEYYGRPLLDKLDPEKRLLGRFYRTSCKYVGGQFVKDLSKVVDTQDLSRVVLVDNNPISFVEQPDNGVLVKSFYNDPNDRAFEEVAAVLDELKDKSDVRGTLRERYGIERLLRKRGGGAAGSGPVSPRPPTHNVRLGGGRSAHECHGNNCRKKRHHRQRGARAAAAAAAEGGGAVNFA